MLARLLVLVALFVPVQLFAQEKKPEPAKGSVTGLVVAKGDHWIDVVPDGAKYAKRFVAPWKGVPDAATVAKLKDVSLNQRVKLDWVVADNRPRIASIEVSKDALPPEKKPEPKPDPKPEAKPDPKPEAKPEAKPDPKPKSVVAPAPQPKG